MKDRGSILVVEDDEFLRETLVTLLEGAGWRTMAARDGDEAVALFRADPAELILTDIMMPRMTGVELVRRIREYDARTPIVILTGFSSMENALEALRAGATEFLEKPFRNREFLAAIERIHEARSAKSSRAKGLEATSRFSWSVVISADDLRHTGLEKTSALLSFQFDSLLTAAGFERRRFAMKRAFEETLALALSPDLPEEFALRTEFDSKRGKIMIKGLSSEILAAAKTDSGDSESFRRLSLIRSFSDELTLSSEGELLISFSRPERFEEEL